MGRIGRIGRMGRNGRPDLFDVQPISPFVCLQSFQPPYKLSQKQLTGALE
jgi:hypothetical protein